MSKAGPAHDASPEGSPFVPFADDAAVRTIGGVTIENGTARIALHGSVDLTRDAAGLARARMLAETLAAIVDSLEKADLPDAVAETTRPAASVKNPFA